MRTWGINDISLGLSVRGRLTQLQTILIANGWVLHDDQYTNQSAPSGFIILKSELAGDNGYVEIFCQNDRIKVRVWRRWNATTHIGTHSSEYLEMPHDLANGSEEYLDASGQHFCIAVTTPAGSTPPILAGVQEPDVKDRRWAGTGLDLPRAYVARPHDRVLRFSHTLFVRRGYYGVEYGAGDAVYYIGYYPTTAMRNGKLANNLDRDFLGDVSGVTGIGASNIKLSASIGGTVDASSEGNLFTFYFAWQELLGAYLTTKIAPSLTYLPSDSRDPIDQFATSATNLAANITDTASSLTVTGDLSSFPASNGFVLLGRGGTLEAIKYATKTGQVLSGLTRGRYGTTAKNYLTNQVVFTDDFNRANGGLGSNYAIAWSGTGDAVASIEGNRAKMSRTVSGSPLAIKYTARKYTDGEVSAVFENSSGGNSTLLILRISDSGDDFICIHTEANALYSYNVVNGVFQQLWGVGTNYDQKKITFRAIGKLFAVLIDDVPFYGWEDTSGIVGLEGYAGFGLGGGGAGSQFVDNLIIKPSLLETPVVLGEYYFRAGNTNAILYAGKSEV